MIYSSRQLKDLIRNLSKEVEIEPMNRKISNDNDYCVLTIN